MRRCLIGLVLAALALGCKAPKPQIHRLGEIQIHPEKGAVFQAKVTVEDGKDPQGLAVSIGGVAAERRDTEPDWFAAPVQSLDLDAFSAWVPSAEMLGSEKLEIEVVATNQGESEQREKVVLLGDSLRRVLSDRLARVAELPLKKAPEHKRGQGTRPRVDVHAGICQPQVDKWFKEDPARVTLQGGAKQVGDAELVLVTCKKMTEQQKCTGYTSRTGGSGGVTVAIFQSEVMARLLVARSGEKIAEKSFPGEPPTCPMFATAKSYEALVQESGRDPKEDEIKAWKKEVTR